MTYNPLSPSGRLETFRPLPRRQPYGRFPHETVNGTELPPVFLITDHRRQNDPAPLLAALPAGSAVILRDYDSPERRHIAQTLRRLTRRYRLKLLIAGDEALAAATGADGMHLPESLHHLAPPARARHPRWLLTGAAHGYAALRSAARHGLDAALLSPVFPTQSHPGARHLGLCRFARLLQRAPLPVIALGGITPAMLKRLKNTKTAGIAAISGFTGR